MLDPSYSGRHSAVRNRHRFGGVYPENHRNRRRERRIDADQQDLDTLARVRAGDRDAYAELVRRHAPMAVRTAGLLGAGADAEDVVQESFVKAYAALGRFRPGSAFRPWLLQIVANETRNLHRSTGRRRVRERTAWSRTEPLLAPAELDDPVFAALSVERRAELLDGLARLSVAHRQVVICRYLLDLDESETAVVLGWPRGTVKSRLHRALRRLSELLGRPAPDRVDAGPPPGPGIEAKEADHEV